jgi:hypothetical protein
MRGAYLGASHGPLGRAVLFADAHALVADGCFSCAVLFVAGHGESRPHLQSRGQNDGRMFGRSADRCRPRYRAMSDAADRLLLYAVVFAMGSRSLCAGGATAGLWGFACRQEAASRICRLTNRWSGRVLDKVPSSYIGVRAAQLNR